MQYFSIIITLCLLLSSNDLSCQIQVTHTEGTQVINGIDISVTPNGGADTLLTYCPEITTPCLIGYSFEQEESIDGSYLFEFDPPIDSIQLNFSGISPGEFIEIFINDEFYPIQSPGNPSNCDDLAILTSNGNITGCENCFASGWTDTYITGIISKIEVSNKVLVGDPQGSLFSIFIFNGITSTANNTLDQQIDFFPNPTNGTLKINAQNILSGTIKIHDINGSLINKFKINSDHQNTIQLDHLREGMYFISFENETIFIQQKVLLF